MANITNTSVTVQHSSLSYGSVPPLAEDCDLRRLSLKVKPVSGQLEIGAQRQANQRHTGYRRKPVRRINHSRSTLAPLSPNIEVRTRKLSTKTVALKHARPSIRLVSSTKADATKDTSEAVTINLMETRSSTHSTHARLPSLSYSSTCSAPSTPESDLAMSSELQSCNPPKNKPSQPISQSLQDSRISNSKISPPATQASQHNHRARSIDISLELYAPADRHETTRNSQLPPTVPEAEISFIDWDDKPSRIARMKQSLHELRRAASPMPKNESKPLPPVPTTPRTEVSFSGYLSSPGQTSNAEERSHLRVTKSLDYHRNERRMSKTKRGPNWFGKLVRRVKRSDSR